jgi:tRNA G18 (ribose-2'-O)-methylase SpoU
MNNNKREILLEDKKITIVLDRLRSAHNTGNIFRIAEAVGASEIIACGYTPAPPHPKLAKTAMGTDNMVPCRVFSSSMEAVEALRGEGNKQILAVETTSDAVFAWEMEYQFPLVLIFGNEALGIQDETVKMCDGVVNLPMFGKKESINVGNSAAAVLYAVIGKNKKTTKI